MPIFWWLGRLSYTKFITRELTSLGVAYAAILLVVEAAAVRRGPAAYAAFVEWLQAPWVIALHGFVLLVLLFHTVTWLDLAPKALVLRVGGRRLPDLAITVAHYLAWAAISALVFWLLVGR
ncbi:MAG TPA: fumarate reductase subunit C [Thermoanaerobaculia bacterium]|nr:fumarate reductase subunit C [Thermoanaerobaculia bacterium]